MHWPENCRNPRPQCPVVTSSCPGSPCWPGSPLPCNLKTIKLESRSLAINHGLPRPWWVGACQGPRPQQQPPSARKSPAHHALAAPWCWLWGRVPPLVSEQHGWEQRRIWLVIESERGCQFTRLPLALGSVCRAGMMPASGNRPGASRQGEQVGGGADRNRKRLCGELGNSESSGCRHPCTRNSPTGPPRIPE